MFPGNPRNRGNCRIYPVASSNTKIAMKGDDPDFIIVELVNSATSIVIALPNTAPIGKSFTFMLTCHPQMAAISLTTEAFTVQVPTIRHGATFISWIVRAGQEARFIYTPNGWLTPRGTLVGSDAIIGSNGIAFGEGSNAADKGVSIGASSGGRASGVAVGYISEGSSAGVAVGANTIATTNGTAIGQGASTNTMDAAVAIGYASKAQRYRELVKSADRATTCLQSFSILDWYGDTADAVATEILLGGVAAQYAVLLNSSAFAFSLLGIARNNADDVGVRWHITGGIRRGANAAATSLIGANTVVTTNDGGNTANWVLAATADTTNGSLKITVTGEAAKTIRWNVRGDISELRF